MGWVYRGEQLDMNSLVAVKLMKLGEQTDAVSVERFLREAAAAGRIHHPHVITVLDAGTAEAELPFIICELLEGVTLADLLDNTGALPVPRSLTIINQVLAAVEASHRMGVIHRDLKPENVMLSPRPNGRDFVKVLDFGIAQTDGSDPGRLTVAGQVLGTPAYMAPEQAMGQTAVEASDLYACGLMLYEMLSGWQPFIGKTVQETLSRQLFDDPPSIYTRLARGDVPEGMDAFFRRALAKDAADRFQTAAELRRALFDLFPETTLTKLPCRRCHRLDGAPASCAREALAEPYLEMAVEAEPPKAETADEKIPRPASRPEPADKTPTTSLRPVTRGRPQVRTRAATSPARDVRTPGHLPARRLEQQRLGSFIDGPGQILCLTGPSGSGKSALLGVAAVMGQAAGFAVLRAGGDDPRIHRPWGAVQTMLRTLLRLSRDSDPAEVERGARRLELLAGDLPGLLDILGQRQAPPGATLATQLSEALISARRALQRAPARWGRPVLLLVDDALLLDTPSLRVVQTLCRASGTGPGVKVVLAAEGHPLSHRDGVETLRLGAIQEEELPDLLEAAGGPSQEAEQIEALSQSAGPSVLYLIQAAQHTLESSSPAPPTLGELIRARIAMLLPAELSLLQLLSAAGGALLPGEAEALLPAGEAWSEVAASLAG